MKTTDLDRDTPGVFQIWESDVRELRANPAAIHNIGGCEPEQLAETYFSSYEELGRHLLYMLDRYGVEDHLVHYRDDFDEQERAEQGVGPHETMRYLTFDCRSNVRGYVMPDPAF